LATNVIMPALGMAQDTGKIIAWLKSEGETVTAGEPIMEVETDKAAVEIEAPASGILTQILAQDGDEVPVAQVVAVIASVGENSISANQDHLSSTAQTDIPDPASSDRQYLPSAVQGAPIQVSPVAERIADENQINLSQVKPEGGRIVKADVLAFIHSHKESNPSIVSNRIIASPKARRLMKEQGISPASVKGTGPGGAVIERDVTALEKEEITSPILDTDTSEFLSAEKSLPMSTTWQIMAERTTQSWVSAPHFYLMRDLSVSNLIQWRESLKKHSGVKITYTDLLVKIVAVSLLRHPMVNAIWQDGKIINNGAVNIGLAMATDDGLVVSVIHNADQMSIKEIAVTRISLIDRAQKRKLRLEDIEDGSITISNLGMYGVDAFNAVLNSPQAALLAVGRIRERVVPVDGQITIQPQMTVNLTCDHRVIDGALGALFLNTLAEMVEDPLSMVE